MKQHRRAMDPELLARLDLPAVPQTVEDRLRQAYAALPDTVPTRRRLPPWVRRGLTAAASCAAAFGLLLGMNGANPAFAESLPLIGGVFASINRQWNPSQNWQENQNRIQALAVECGGEPVTVPAGGLLEKPFQVQLKEVYYDGYFVFAGLELQMEQDYEGVQVSHMKGYDILLNGESQVPHNDQGQTDYTGADTQGFADLSEDHIIPMGQGVYRTQRAFRVPERLQGADSLDVTLCFEELWEPGSSFFGTSGTINSSPFALSFTVQKQEADLRAIDCQGIEMGGVKLVSAFTSSTALSITVEYDASQYRNPAAGATFEDGIYMGSLHAQHGHGSLLNPQGGTEQAISVYAGLSPEEDRKVVWRLFDKNGSQQVEAVFILDFQKGTVQVGGPEDVPTAPVFDYACGIEAVRGFGGGYQVELLHLSQSKPTIYIQTDDSPRNLRMEFCQEGQTLVTREFSPEILHRGDYHEYYNLTNGSATVRDEDRYPDSEHDSYMVFLPELYVALDPSQPVTVKLYDKSSSELLMEETVTLTQSEVHEPPPSVVHEEEMDGDGACVSSEAEE